MRALNLALLFLAILPVVVLAKPSSGKIEGIVLSLNQSNSEIQVSTVCTKIIGLYHGSHISAKGTVQGSHDGIPVEITLEIFLATCANVVPEDKDTCSSIAESLFVEKVAVNTYLTTVNKSIETIIFHPKDTVSFTKPPPSDEPPPSADTTGNATGTNDATGDSRRKRSEDVAVDPSKMADSTEPVYSNFSSGVYFVRITAQKTDKKADVNITLKVKAKNPHGYLSAVDFSAFVFYGVMTAFYAILSIIWFILMCFSYKDLVRLQFWIAAVLILGFLEKTFFVSEYSTINQGAESAGLILVAEAVSAAKRALSRMLLIIVALGFGTVKPRLGDSLGKVVAAGAIYFVFALVDGVVRVKQDTAYTRDTSATVTLALLVVLEVIIFYWIFASLVATRRALRLRKNYIKLSLYNHFAYTLIFGLAASLVFFIWVFIELNYPRNNCLTDWREVWLRDCFWHILFFFILIIIMILWRPSSNRIRFAYSLVHDQDEEEEEVEQGPNKNFETVKMRQVSKPEALTPPAASSQAEDDLRWVEENLPTSAVDKALPLILDSDEEVMTTRFEISKMN